MRDSLTGEVILAIPDKYLESITIQPTTSVHNRHLFYALKAYFL